MTNPSDLGDQLARTLQSLEKATPQVLELATRNMRFEALVDGLTELVVLIASCSIALWLWRWLQRDEAKERGGAPDEIRLGGVLAIVALGVIAVVIFVHLPDQVSKFCNARYWAIADLLSRVKP